jgi:hypothetical protein
MVDVTMPEDSRAGLRGVFVKLDPHAMGIANVAEAFDEISKLTPEVGKNHILC